VTRQVAEDRGQRHEEQHQPQRRDQSTGDQQPVPAKAIAMIPISPNVSIRWVGSRKPLTGPRLGAVPVRTREAPGLRMSGAADVR
jgi:hypothetical protein